MRKYEIILENNKPFYVSHIGVNHTAVGTSIGGVASSYDKAFDNEDYVNVESGIGDIRYCTIGDISDAYKMLKDAIISKMPRDLLEYSLCVQQVVLQYFGNFSNIEERLKYFPDHEEVSYDGKKTGCLSDLIHKNAAMCIERAMLSQNLLFEIGIKSYFKASGIMLNGKPDNHAYNLIDNDGKYYIFDATIPTIVNGEICPLICEIPKKVFEELKRPEIDRGISVEVRHYNPLQQADYEIIYDAGRKEKYTIENTYTKR